VDGVRRACFGDARHGLRDFRKEKILPIDPPVAHEPIDRLQTCRVWQRLRKAPVRVFRHGGHDLLEATAQSQIWQRGQHPDRRSHRPSARNFSSPKDPIEH
jgi:hypothetical protein